MKSTVSSKGQVTIPIAVRKRLGLAANTTVAFDLREDGVLLRKVVLGHHPVDKVFGLLKPARPASSMSEVLSTRRSASSKTLRQSRSICSALS